MVGGVDAANKPENNFTLLQFISLLRMLRFYKALFPEAEILGHCDLYNGKACPSFDVRSWLKDNPLKENHNG